VEVESKIMQTKSNQKSTSRLVKQLARKNISPLIPLAISKAVATEAVQDAKKQIAPGIYPIDVTIRLTGQIKLGEEQMQKITQTAEPWKLLTLALSKLNGVTIESLVRESDNLTDEQIEDVKAKAKDAVATIKGKTEKKIAGKMTGKISYTVQ
jgi:hypothetical protein